MNLNNLSDPYGTPLAVCINDCEIDQGQQQPELAQVCFRLGCAFAPMRWGSKDPTLEKITFQASCKILSNSR